MSWTLVERVFGLIQLTRGQRQTLQSLARHAAHDGTNSYPSVETIMEETGLSRRGVQMSLRSLEEKNLIACKSGRHGGRYVSARYTLLVENWGEFEAHSEEEKKQRNECALATGNSALATQKGAVGAGNSVVSAENSALTAPESVKESVPQSVHQSSPASPSVDGDCGSMDGLMLIDLNRRFIARTGSGNPECDYNGYWFYGDHKVARTGAPKPHHESFYLGKIQEKGIDCVRLVVKTFAGDNENDFSRICPAAVLMKRWKEYEERAAQKAETEQDPSRWHDIIDQIEEDGFALSESEKSRVRELAERHGTGRLEDAYYSYHSDCLRSKLGEFLADPSLYLEDDILAA